MFKGSVLRCSIVSPARASTVFLCFWPSEIIPVTRLSCLLKTFQLKFSFLLVPLPDGSTATVSWRFKISMPEAIPSINVNLFMFW